MYDSNNVFAKILRGELPSVVVYEDEILVAVKDIHPAATVHVLAIPRREFISFEDFSSNASGDYIAKFFQSVRAVTHALDLHENGYRLVTNHGVDGGQVVPHFHVHILGGQRLKGF